MKGDDGKSGKFGLTQFSTKSFESTITVTV